MADVICLRCGEPWDAYELRQEYPEEWRRLIRAEGCDACGFMHVGKPLPSAKEIDEFLALIEEATDGHEVLEAIEAISTLAGCNDG